jgi:hypothetical protein
MSGSLHTALEGSIWYRMGQFIPAFSSFPTVQNQELKKMEFIQKKTADSRRNQKEAFGTSDSAYTRRSRCC